MPRGLFVHAAAAMGGKIYVTGGEITDETTDETGDIEAVNSAYVYDPQANAWTQLASMGNVRRSHASAAVGGKLYVFGGRSADDDGDDEFLSTAEVYDPASDSWAQVTSLAHARSLSMAAALSA